MTPAESPTKPSTSPAGWNLTVAGRRHRVEILGSAKRTLTWYVDDELVATKKSAEKDVHLKPGVGLDAGSPLAPSDAGTVRLKFTDFGRPRRVSWYEAEDDVSAAVHAVVGTGGTDFDPEPGSAAALRAERIRRHPHRYAAVATGVGLAKVGFPLLIAYLMFHWTVSLPWPNVNLPSIPWPDWHLPAIPWPDLHLPHWSAPAWVGWIADHLKYVVPVVVALFVARSEIKRQRQQDALKAQPDAPEAEQ